MDQRHADLLRRLAINDETIIETVLGTSLAGDLECGADPRCLALARVAALFAGPPSAASLHWAIAGALVAGATDDDLVDVLVAVAPVVGAARVSWVAPEVAIALDLDLDVDNGGEVREPSR